LLRALSASCSRQGKWPPLGTPKPLAPAGEQSHRHGRCVPPLDQRRAMRGMSLMRPDPLPCGSRPGTRSFRLPGLCFQIELSPAWTRVSTQGFPSRKPSSDLQRVMQCRCHSPPSNPAVGLGRNNPCVRTLPHIASLSPPLKPMQVVGDEGNKQSPFRHRNSHGEPALRD